MSAHNPSDTARKPSGSSSHSGVRSGTSSPSIAQPQRKLTPTAASNMLGVAMSGSSNAMKGLNSGWQVWPSKRNASVSSAASISELASSQGEGAFRSGINENWTTPRSSSATWDDASASPQRKEYSNIDSLNLHHPRQRQANVTTAATFSGNRSGDRSATGSKSGQFAQYEVGLSKDTTNQQQRYTTSGSPPHSFPTVPYATTSSIQNGAGSGYEPLPQQSMPSADDLAMAFRGMAVEDDVHSRQQGSSSQPLSSSPGNRGPSHQARPPYGSFPQADYAYYGNPSIPREAYVDYPLGFDAYRTQVDPTAMYLSPAMSSATASTVYPGAVPQHPMPDHRQTANVFYDYSGAPRPTSQYYYAPATMVYSPTSPMNHQAAPNPVMGSSKKRDQYNGHQQLAPQNMMYGAMRSSPSPIQQSFGAVMDYGGMQMPVVSPGGPVYMPQAMQYYPTGHIRVTRPGDEGQGVLGLRSARLEEFRANRSRKWDIKDIFGFVVEFSGDQHGSRFIQQRLETATAEEKQRVFDEITPGHIIGLVSDVFGNYVIQKLLEHGTPAQRTIIVNAMEGHILTLSLHMYGCRVVQRAVEYITPEQQTALLKEIEPHVLRCVKDANGNHVIQKIIERVAPERLVFVDVFRGAVFELSTHAYGCRVLQRCLEHLPHTLTHPIIEELHKYTINLMQDQFGNYVIQFVLEHGQPQDRALVVNKLRGQLLHMARHKFASNVVEKALVCAPTESRRTLIEEILTVQSDGSNPVVVMMKDQFGNYVLQRAMTVAEGDQREELFNAVKPQLATMRRVSNAYNKHLLAIERLLEKYHGPLISEPAPPTTSSS